MLKGQRSLPSPSLSTMSTCCVEGERMTLSLELVRERENPSLPSNTSSSRITTSATRLRWPSGSKVRSIEEKLKSSPATEEIHTFDG